MAARLVSHLLDNSGKAPTAEKIQQLYRFNTGYGPALTFTYNKRIGAVGQTVFQAMNGAKPQAVWLPAEL